MILASGEVNQDFRSEIGGLLTSRIPLGGSLAILRLLDQNSLKYQNITICLDISENLLGEVLISKHNNLSVLYGNKESSFSKTLLLALRNIFESNATSTDIVFGDSLNLNLQGNDVIIVSKLTERASWTTVSREKNRLLFGLSSEKISEAVVAGAFAISKIDILLQIMEELDGVSLEEFFFESLIEYDLRLNNGVLIEFSDDWQDIGHLATYFRTKRELLSQSSRVFNNILFDEATSTIIKSSEDYAKINSEYLWFENLPNNLRLFTPNYSREGQQSSYRLEFIDSPSVAEHWISGNDDESYWNKCFDSCSKFLNIMLENQNPSIPNLIHELFIDKLNTRIISLIKDPNTSSLVSGQIKINGRTSPNYENISSVVSEILKPISNNYISNVMHGDFFFGNIIFNQRSSQIICFDPRGYRDDSGIYGNHLYDLAKLWHSVNSKFDFLSANLFSLTNSHGNIDLLVAQPKSNVASNIANTWLSGYCAEFASITTESLKILGASLLLCAAPLHYDSPERQKALIAQALIDIRDLL